MFLIGAPSPIAIWWSCASIQERDCVGALSPSFPTGHIHESNTRSANLLQHTAFHWIAVAATMDQSSFQRFSSSEQCLLGGSLHPLFSWRCTRPCAVRAIPSCAIIVSLCYLEVSAKHIPSSRVALSLFQIEDKLFLHFISLWWCGMWAVWQMYGVTYPHNVGGCGGDCFVERKLERFGPRAKENGLRWLFI